MPPDFLWGGGGGRSPCLRTAILGDDLKVLACEEENDSTTYLICITGPEKERYTVVVTCLKTLLINNRTEPKSWVL